MDLKWQKKTSPASRRCSSFYSYILFKTLTHYHLQHIYDTVSLEEQSNSHTLFKREMYIIIIISYLQKEKATLTSSSSSLSTSLSAATEHIA